MCNGKSAMDEMEKRMGEKDEQVGSVKCSI